MPNLIWRFPDRLQHIYSLRMIREGDFLCQTKHDGYYAVIIKDGDYKVLSRHNKPLAVSPSMMEAVRSLDLKDGTVLHGEWTGLRQADRSESIVLFSITYLAYEWLGTLTEEERFGFLTSLGMKPHPSIPIVENQITGYAQMYKRMVDDPRTEGVVLKKRTTKLIGDLRSSKDNPGFYKLKWRGGNDGLSKMIIPNPDLITQDLLEGAL